MRIAFRIISVLLGCAAVWVIVSEGWLVWHQHIHIQRLPPGMAEYTETLYLIGDRAVTARQFYGAGVALAMILAAVAAGAWRLSRPVDSPAGARDGL